MRPFRAAALAGCALAALAFASPAWAAIGAPANLLGNATLPNGYLTGGVQNHNDLTTTVDAPVGSLVIVPTAFSGTATITSVADNAGGGSGNCGGAYSVAVSVQLGSARLGILYCNGLTIDLPVGGVIKTTFSASTAKMGEEAFTVSGAATSGLVDVNTSANGTLNQAVSGMTLTPSTSTETILIACVDILNGNTSDSYAEDTAHGWTAIQGNPAGSSSNLLLHCAYKIVSGTPAANPWAPAWSTNNRTWTAVAAAFKGPGAAVSNGSTLGSLGVGR